MKTELRRLYDDPIAKLRRADEGALQKSCAAKVAVRHLDERGHELPGKINQWISVNG
jgi:hypothetical protein